MFGDLLQRNILTLSSLAKNLICPQKIETLTWDIIHRK